MPIFIILISIIIGKHIHMCFKFHQNRTINEEFNFWEVKGVVLVGLGAAKVCTT